MSDGTEISWAEATWNVATGCTRVSDGCTHCYIERTPPFRMAHRKFDGEGIGATTGVQLHPERLAIPLHWRKPRRIFVNSLADLFHEQIPDEYIAEVFGVMATCADHVFQVLTKRHGRMKSLLNNPRFREAVGDYQREWMVKRPSRAQHWPDVWPLPNVWGGVTVESQQWAEPRIGALLDTPFAVRWVSFEPLLEPVDVPFWWDSKPVRGIDWIVVGGESGPGARPMHPDWARKLRDQATALGIAFHFKQWGEWEPDPDDGHGWENGRRCFITKRGEVTPGPAFGTAGTAMRRVGKKAAGRELDGRTWDEYPERVA